uniref:DUF1117 domain-containing protein n=1 Tax=Triticum urartu TaxID=4572 RepID=A0A8R7U7Z1_TRIUA
MPCSHMYHHDYILPWLALRNSCPLCRHKLPTDVARPAPVCDLGAADDQGSNTGAKAGSEEEIMVGLTIWRLPGGGFAVGRWSDERELPSQVSTLRWMGVSTMVVHRGRSHGHREGAVRHRGELADVCLTTCLLALTHPSLRSDWSSVFTYGLRSRSTSWRSYDSHADAIAR